MNQVQDKKPDEGCDPKGTAWIRDAAYPCPACGTSLELQYMGNTLVSYFCPKCGHEIGP